MLNSLAFYVNLVSLCSLGYFVNKTYSLENTKLLFPQVEHLLYESALIFSDVEMEK